MPETAVRRNHGTLIAGLIILIVGLAVFIAGIVVWKANGVDQYIKTTSFSITDQPVDKISKLDISVGSVEIDIKRGGDKLNVYGENLPEDIEKGIQNDTFVIKTKSKGFGFIMINGTSLNNNILNWMSDQDISPKLTIEVPDKVFDQINIDLGTGAAKIDGLSAKRFELDLGTGSLTASGLNVEGTLEIDQGTGHTTITNCDVGRLDFDGGVGHFEYEGTIKDGLDADCGVGAVDITIKGSYNDYDIDADTGIGGVDIDKGDTSGSGRGNIPVKIDGGVGSVHLKFVK